MSGAYSVEYLITAKDQVSAVLNNIKRNFEAVQKSISSLGSKPFLVQADTSKARAAIDSLEQSLKDLQDKSININATTKIIGQEQKSMMPQGAGMAMLGGALGRAVGLGVAGMAAKQVVGDFMDLEMAQLGLKKALDVSGPALKTYTDVMRNLSSELGKTQEEITRTAVRFAKADSTMTPDSLSQLTKLNYAASAAWDIQADSVADALQVMQAIFNLDYSGLEKVSNSVDLLGDKFGVLSEQYLVDFVTVGAGVGKSLGLSQDQILAWGTVAGEAKVIASEASNAMKHLGADVLAPDDKAIAAFRQLGIEMDRFGKMDAGTRMQTVLSSMSAYHGANKAQIAKDIIGGNYDDTLMRMAVNSDKFGKAMSMLGDSTQSAGRVMKGLSMESETAQGRLNRLVESARNVGVAIGETIVGITFGPEVSAVWSNLGDQIQSIWSIITGGGSDAKTAISVLESAVLAVSVAVGAAVTGFGQLIDVAKGAGEAVDKFFSGDFSGSWDALKGGFGAAADRGSKFVGTTVKSGRDLIGRQRVRAAATAHDVASSPVAAAASNTAAIKQQAGIQTGGADVQAAAKTMQDAGTKQTAAAQAAQQAAATQVQTAATDTATAALNTNSATMQAQAATLQTQAATQIQSVGAQFQSAAQQMMAAAQQMMAAASTPLTVDISGSLGTQGRP